MSEELSWDRTKPFIIEVLAKAENVDGYGHVSTHNYVRWMIDCAFAHSTALGLPESKCRELARGMAAVHADLDLLGSAYEGDLLKVATWIIKSDSKLRLGRHCQIVDASSGKTLARADFDFVCTNLETGRPVRMPEEFKQTYVVDSEEVSS